MEVREPQVLLSLVGKRVVIRLDYFCICVTTSSTSSRTVEGMTVSHDLTTESRWSIVRDGLLTSGTPSGVSPFDHEFLSV